jgi:hypothetical protein
MCSDERAALPACRRTDDSALAGVVSGVGGHLAFPLRLDHGTALTPHPCKGPSDQRFLARTSSNWTGIWQGTRMAGEDCPPPGKPALLATDPVCVAVHSVILYAQRELERSGSQ